MLYLDNLPTLGAGASGLDHLPGGLAVLGELLPSLPGVLRPDQLHGDVVLKIFQLREKFFNLIHHPLSSYLVKQV